MFGFSRLNLTFRVLVSSLIFSPPFPIIIPGLLVEIIIFSPTGVYSIFTLLTFPFPRDSLTYSLTANSSFLNLTTFFSSIIYFFSLTRLRLDEFFPLFYFQQQFLYVSFFFLSL